VPGCKSQGPPLKSAAESDQLWLYYFVSGTKGYQEALPIGFLGLHEICTSELPEFPYYPLVRNEMGAAEQKLQKCQLRCAGKLTLSSGVLTSLMHIHQMLALLNHCDILHMYPALLVASLHA
jgi:hypothetical protein